MDATYCVPSGWQINLKFADMVQSGQIKVERLQGLNNCIKMLVAGRVKIFTTNERGGLDAIEESGVPEGSVVLAIGPAIYEIPLYLSWPKT